MKVYLVVTVQEGSEDPEVDVFADIIGVYDTRAKANLVVTKMDLRESIQGLNYDYLVSYKAVTVIERTLNKTIVNQKD